MFDALRTAVSGSRTRFVRGGYDLDLTYITPNVIAMGLPSEGIESTYRNSAATVARMLRQYHAGKFAVVNLSERRYDYSLFDGRVWEFGFPDHHAPPLDVLWQCCSKMHEFLRVDERRVVAVHCKAGKGRTGVVCAAYLIYSGMFYDPTASSTEMARRAMAFFREQRGQGVKYPSQARYVAYFAALVDRCLRSGPDAALTAPPGVSALHNVPGAPAGGAGAASASVGEGAGAASAVPHVATAPSELAPGGGSGRAESEPSPATDDGDAGSDAGRHSPASDASGASESDASDARNAAMEGDTTRVEALASPADGSGDGGSDAATAVAGAAVKSAAVVGAAKAEAEAEAAATALSSTPAVPIAPVDAADAEKAGLPVVPPPSVEDARLASTSDPGRPVIVTQESFAALAAFDTLPLPPPARMRVSKIVFFGVPVVSHGGSRPHITITTAPWQWKAARLVYNSSWDRPNPPLSIPEETVIVFNTHDCELSGDVEITCQNLPGREPLFFVSFNTSFMTKAQCRDGVFRLHLADLDMEDRERSLRLFPRGFFVDITFDAAPESDNESDGREDEEEEDVVDELVGADDGPLADHGEGASAASGGAASGGAASNGGGGGSGSGSAGGSDRPGGGRGSVRSGPGTRSPSGTVGSTDSDWVHVSPVRGTPSPAPGSGFAAASKGPPAPALAAAPIPRAGTPPLAPTAAAAGGAGASASSGTGDAGAGAATASAVADAATGGAVATSVAAVGSCMGWLMKMGGGLTYGWRRRWFVLRDDTVAYYKSPHKAKPMGCIRVADMLSVAQVPRVVSGRLLCFHIVCEARTYILQAPSAPALQQWVTSLTLALGEVTRKRMPQLRAPGAAMVGGGPGGSAGARSGADGASDPAAGVGAGTAERGGPGDADARADAGAARRVPMSSGAPRAGVRPGGPRPRALSAADVSDLRRRVTAFYSVHHPEKSGMDHIDKVMEYYRGREWRLQSDIEQKYGVPLPP